MTGRREYDVVVYGATSFVGQILCRYLVRRHGAVGTLRWAIAGRDLAKLDQVARSTGADVPRIVADASDRAALDALTASTRVVVSTVGPYALYGSELVESVVEAGIDYCDLTGEVQWMRRMIDQHQTRAVATGARVVHACGFDSIPSDLGTWFTQQRAIEQFGEPCTEVRMSVAGAKGGVSGGTLASGMNMFEEMAAAPELRAITADPYVLAPVDLRTGPKQPGLGRPTHDDRFQSWVGPFVMAPTNSAVVLRSHALLGRPWGRDFTYGETMMTGVGAVGAVKAYAMTAGLAAFAGVASLGPTRRLLGKVMPKPGSGPDAATQQAGYFDIRFVGRTASGATIRTKVTGDQDPGYGSTAKMLGESAAGFLDLDSSDVGGGFWTPASAFGDALVERLEAHAGVRFDVL
ncbi:MAG TPA: saccharopine dehydrogenase NADP-binding domain-containing protein [Ilumatobacteraceae bacterium]|nr:saccharopine dehydrogenase NADP-binding domain-containing protein [Ilumatobacteraceae bacterium]